MKDIVQFEDEDEILAAEIALGLLDAGQVQLTRARMVRDPDFAGLVVNWQESLVRMTDNIGSRRPPARVRHRIMTQVFAPPRVPLLDRIWVWKAVSFAALGMMGFIGWLAFQSAQNAPAVETAATGAVYVTQLTAETIPLQVLAVIDPARGDIAVSRLGGLARQGRSLQMWAIVPDTPPVSLGLLPVSDSIRIKLDNELLLRASEITLAISDEPDGGSPTGAPTGDVVATSAMNGL